MVHKISTSVEHPIMIIGYADTKETMALDIVNCDHSEDIENILDNFSVAIDGALVFLEGMAKDENPDISEAELTLIRASKIEYIINRLKPCVKSRKIQVIDFENSEVKA